jgi:protein-disulfide isomerase
MIKLISVFGVYSALLVSVAAAADSTAVKPERATVIAEIDGRPITLGEFEEKRSDSLFQAKTSLYQAELRALDEFIDDYLLKAAAKRENVSVEQLLQKHVDSTIAKDPPEEVLRLYFEGVDTNESYEAVRPKILDQLRQRRLEKARIAYVHALRTEAHVAIKLSPPRTDISLTNTPIRGEQRSPVVLVEYADYECPYCQQIEPELKKLEAEYKGKISFAYKDVPLPMHSHAQKAAEAARCAGLQGKYWEYHDVLFTSKELDVPALKRYAGTLNLDTTAFNKCLDSGEQAELVKTDLTEAQRLQLPGTPSFFINGRSLGSGIDYATLRRELDLEVAGSGSRSEQQTGRQ